MTKLLSSLASPLSDFLLTSSCFSAVNNTTVEVKFVDAVEDLAALNFAIEGLEIKNKVIKQTNAKTVVLTTAVQEAGKKYTVTANGSKLGDFVGVSAVIPTKVDVVTKSIQGVIGKDVTVQAKVTVAEGQSKAGIPVTFNIPGNTSTLFPAITAEALTDADGVATYTYTRYGATTDDVIAYATGDRTKSSTGKVYWAASALLTISEVTTGNELANGAKKVYKVTGAPGQTVNIGYSENVNTTANKLAKVGVIAGTSLKTGGVNYPYQLASGTANGVTITLDSKGEGSFTISGSDETVTPFVWFDGGSTRTITGYQPIRENGEIVGFDPIYTTTGGDNKFAATELVAYATTVTFSDILYYSVDVKAVKSEYAAYDYGVKGDGGRDYVVTLTHKDGTKATKGEKVYVFLDENNSSDNVYLLDSSDAKLAPSKGASNVLELTVNSDGQAEFTVYGTSNNLTNARLEYATPVVFIDRNANKQLNTSDISVTGDITYFTAATETSVGLSYIIDGKKVTAAQANKDEVTVRLTVLDQNDKVVKNTNKQRATFEVQNYSSTGVVVNNGAEFAHIPKTFDAPVVNGVATITLQAKGPISNLNVRGAYDNFVQDASITFTSNPAGVTRSTVASVDATRGSESITLANGVKIYLDGLTLRAENSNTTYNAQTFLKEVLSIGEVVDYDATNKTLTVKDLNGTGYGDETSAATVSSVITAINDANTQALVIAAYNSYAALTTAQKAQVTNVATLETKVDNQIDSLSTAVEADYTEASWEAYADALELPETTLAEKGAKLTALFNANNALKSAATYEVEGLTITFSPAVENASLAITDAVAVYTVAGQDAPTANAAAVGVAGNTVVITVLKNEVTDGDTIEVTLKVNGEEKTITLEASVDGATVTWAEQGEEVTP